MVNGEQVRKSNKTGVNYGKKLTHLCSTFIKRTMLDNENIWISMELK